MKLTLAAVALALAVGSAGSAWAEGNAPAPTDPALKNVEKDKAPIGDGMVSPDAATKVDEDDLIKSLMGDDKDKGTPEDKFKAIIGRMEDSSKRLNKEDPGEVTQETQRRIITDLDVLIEMAKKSECNKSGNNKPQAGQQKQKSESMSSGSKKPNRGGDTAAENSVMNNGDADANPGAKPINEVDTSAWNLLPPRDRDAIFSGLKEEVLPKWRDMVSRYYEELAKANHH